MIVGEIAGGMIRKRAVANWHAKPNCVKEPK